MHFHTSCSIISVHDNERLWYAESATVVKLYMQGTAVHSAGRAHMQLLCSSFLCDNAHYFTNPNKFSNITQFILPWYTWCSHTSAGCTVTTYNIKNVYGNLVSSPDHTLYTSSERGSVSYVDFLGSEVISCTAQKWEALIWLVTV